MHILIIPSWYKTPQQHLSGTFFEEQARMLLNKGYKVGVLYPTLNSGFNVKTSVKQFFKKNQPTDFVDNGIPTMYSFSDPIVSSRFQKINYLLACFTAYNKYKAYTLKHGKPDVIHAHSVFIGGIVARYISRKENIKYVFTEHTSSILQSKWITTNHLYTNIVKKIFTDAEYAVFVSNAFRQDLISKYNIQNINAVTIPNVVNPIFYKGLVKKEKSTPFVLLCIAVLNKNKQHTLLFDACNKIISQGYNIMLNLIGDGPDRKELMEYANEIGILHLVTFMGSQSREIVKQEIDKAHVVVSASKFETFGLSIVEGFACGRPVVSIDSGGPRDTVTLQNGFLVEENTPEKLAGGIITVMDNYESYDQEKIKTDCCGKYSENAVLALLEPVYKTVLDKL